MASGRMHAGEMCTCHTSHALSPHTSRDAPCGVCLGVWRVVFWPSWCLVHHTTMTPFKRARRGEWAYACWRDVLGPPHYHDTFQTCQMWRVGVCMLARCARAKSHAHSLTTLESRCTLWRVFGSMACCFLAKLVLGPPHYHDTFQTYQTWRVGVCMLARCARAKSHAHSLTTLESRCTLWRVFGSMACCFLAKLVLGPPHYHDTFQTYQTWRVGVCMLARCARAKSHAHSLTTLESRCTLWRVFGSMACCFLAKLVLGPPHYHDTFQTYQTWRV